MTLHEIAAQTAVTLAGVISLYVFFRALKSDWPHSYFSVSDMVSQRISASPGDYFAFRVLPVFAVCFFVAGSLANVDAEHRIAPFAVAVIQTFATNGRALWQWFRRGMQAFGFWSATSGHALALVGSVTAAGVAVVLAEQRWAPLLLPSAAEVASSLWTAVIAAILGAYVVRASSRPAGDISVLVERSRRSIGAELWDYSRAAADRSGIDRGLFLSILVAENLQRPRWIRSVEGLRHRFGLKGTYDVMQAYGPPPIDDRRSIDMVAEALAGARQPEDSYGYDWARPVIARHNPDPGFIEMVLGMMYLVPSEEH